MNYLENDIAKIILDKAFLIHRELGPGLLESIYEKVLIHELKKSGLEVKSQEPISFFFRMGWNGFRKRF
ncbi:GxxExxY protein [Algoriphagus sp.]|uniref:GxxExxY protein n=1 Tax=Algoriphagus sp. TaxID=1872435 RepID=UPI0025C4F25D|nr:GxxExxY protein [Algoriphagus sp.]